MPGKLPDNLAPRGLSRDQAAAYVGVGADLFDGLVRDGTMPPGLKWGGRRVWDRVALDRSMDVLSGFAKDGPAGGANKQAIMEAIRNSS